MVYIGDVFFWDEDKCEYPTAGELVSKTGLVVSSPAVPAGIEWHVMKRLMEASEEGI